MTPRDALTMPWYALENDLIGGWCVHTADVACSQLRYLDDPTHQEVASFIDESAARHIVGLHNAALISGQGGQAA